MRAFSLLAIGLLVLGTAVSSIPAAENVSGEDLGETLEKLLPGMGADDIGARRDPQQQWQEICFQAGAPGNEARRAEVCRLMSAKLGSKLPKPACLWLLKQLEQIGRAECVDAVAVLLDDPDPLAADAARRALARNAAAQAGAKLRDALSATGDCSRKIALINILGYRAEEASVPLLARELGNQDAKIAAAAAAALGKLATPAAAKALAVARQKSRGDLRLRISDSYLRCADRFQLQGKTTQAAAIYRELYQPNEPARLAALKGMIGTAGDRAATIIFEILRGDDTLAQSVAVNQIDNIPDAAVTALVEGLFKLPPAGQVILLGALGVRGDRGALPAVVTATKSDDDQVKLAAIQALGTVGNVSTVPMLVETMFSGGELGEAARRSLESFRCSQADGKLIDILKNTANLGRRRMCVEVLSQRRAVSAVPVLLTEALSDDENLRRKSLVALGRLADAKDVPGMVKAMWKTKGGQRNEAEKAVAEVCQRIKDPQQQAQPVLALYASADDTDRNGLLPVLGRIGCAQGLAAVREALASSDAQRYDAGVRALCNWPDATVADELLKIAETGREARQRIDALRASARVAVRSDLLSDDKELSYLERAYKLASRDQERNLILDRASLIHRIETFRFAARHLDEPGVSERAARTIVRVARQSSLRDRYRDEVSKALKKVIDVAKDRSLVDTAKSYLEE